MMATKQQTHPAQLPVLEDPESQCTCMTELLFCKLRKKLFQKIGSETRKQMVFSLDVRKYTIDWIRIQL